MNKFFRFLITVFLAIVIGLAIVWAGVQIKTWYTKQYKFNITPGQRIIVVDESCTQVRVYPKEARIFDSGKIKEGKRLSGVLIEK